MGTRRAVAILASLSLCLSCQCTPPAEIDAGTGEDAGTQSNRDAGTDAGIDAGIDAGTDAGTDAGIDAGIDAGTDAGTDAGIDAGTDAGIDAGTDAGLVLDGGWTDAGVWTWLWKPLRTDSMPVWGTLGQADAGSCPGRRGEMAAWATPDGGLLLFGGNLMSGSGPLGVDNSLWQFTGTYWVRLSGSAGVDGRATFGTLGVRSCNNIPGARTAATSWVGPDGGYYLYGGDGFSWVGPRGTLGDVWRYDGCWTWVAGPQTTYAAHTYLTQGQPGGSPGGRTLSMAWSTGSAVWLFGGYGTALFADLWRFDGTTWTWVHGPNPAPTSVNVRYGQRGVPHPLNTPGSRIGSATWADATGALWLYGGQGPGEMGVQTMFGDLWKFDGTHWVWMGGSPGPNAMASHGTQGLALSTNTPGVRLTPLTWTDGPDVWMFGGVQDFNNRWADLWKFDGTFWTWVSGPDQVNQFSIRGTMGVSDPMNRPGSRSFGAAAGSPEGALIFGGTGADLSTASTLGDAWRYRK